MDRDGQCSFLFSEYRLVGYSECNDSFMTRNGKIWRNFIRCEVLWRRVWRPLLSCRNYNSNLQANYSFFIHFISSSFFVVPFGLVTSAINGTRCNNKEILTLSFKVSVNFPSICLDPLSNEKCDGRDIYF